MPKMRIHDLARQLGMSNKDLIEKINKEFGLNINNHAASLSEKQIEYVMGTKNKNQEKQPTHDKNNTEASSAHLHNDNGRSDERHKEERHKEERHKEEHHKEERHKKDKNNANVEKQANAQTNSSSVDVSKEPTTNEKSEKPQSQQRHQSHNNRHHQGNRQNQNNRPQGSQGSRPQNQSNRPQGERHNNQNNRPQGERQPYQSNRPQGERQPYQSNRPQGERQPYQGNRQQNQGNRPQGERQSHQRPQGERQPYQGNRSQGERQPYQRPQGERQPYQGNRPQGERQPYQRPQGDRPQNQGNRPQGERQPYQRPQGDRPQNQGNRPQGERQQYGNRPQYGQSRGQIMDKDRDSQDTKRPQSRQQSRSSSDKGKLSQQEKPQKQFQKIQQDKHHQRNQFKSDEPEINNKKLLKHGHQKPVEKPKAVVAEPEEPKLIKIPPVITLKELAENMNKSGAALVKVLMKRGQMVNVNQEVDFQTASEIALEFNVLVEELVEVDIFEEAFAEEPDKDEDIKPRPPVVVVMGHVDHGKTSLLDAIRSTNVVKGEAGGITQHIGAYVVAIDGKPITFLDTPGHEAFTAMRLRGAQVTDVAVLVVAADDGVMPQTIEAINHAKAANVEIIVAINMIDKPNANPDKVKRELLDHGLVSEDYGGETICVPVSAKNKTNIDQLLEMIILVAEMKDLKANPSKNARGTIIEALLDKGRGTVATVLVQDGTLAIGDPIVAGSIYGKIRAMIDDKGKRVKKAGPGIPVEILGLPDVPQAGDMFYVARNEKQARQVAESYFAKGRVEMIKATPQKVSLDDLFTQIKSGNIKDLNIVIKADVQGSVEALKNSLEKLSNEEVRIRTIHGGVGAITESDVMLASASTAIIIGFNVRPEASAKSVATEQQVDIRLYRIIYDAIEDIESAMKGMLDPIFEEKILGHAQIRQLFKASGIGTIGGSYVTDGKITRNAKVRVVRDGIVIYDGTLETLKRFKDDVKEVSSGYECGILLSKYNDIKVDDIVEAYVMEEIER